jgi:carbon-monoxide dehydrogenase medium subunit
MKPPAFDYRCVESVQEAIELLASHRGDAKVIAGGQSLIPMLNFRVVRPGLLVDIGKLVELDFLRKDSSGGLGVGALTRHRMLETSPLVASLYPIVPDVMRHVAHLAIRNRGTIGGSLSHADPAAELPMLTRLLDATIVVRSVRGEREIPAQDFFVGALTTALEDDELVVRIDLPHLVDGTGWAFQEYSRRAGDFALAAVGALIEVNRGVVRRARVAMMGVGDTPVRCPGAEHALVGCALDDETIEAATEAACAPLEPNKDLHASSEFRKHLAAVLCRRVLRLAAKRVKETA